MPSTTHSRLRGAQQTGLSRAETRRLVVRAPPPAVAPIVQDGVPGLHDGGDASRGHGRRGRRRGPLLRRRGGAAQDVARVLLVRPGRLEVEVHRAGVDAADLDPTVGSIEHGRPLKSVEALEAIGRPQ